MWTAPAPLRLLLRWNNSLFRIPVSSSPSHRSRPPPSLRFPLLRLRFRHEPPFLALPPLHLPFSPASSQQSPLFHGQPLLPPLFSQPSQAPITFQHRCLHHFLLCFALILSKFTSIPAPHCSSSSPQQHPPRLHYQSSQFPSPLLNPSTSFFIPFSPLATHPPSPRRAPASPNPPQSFFKIFSMKRTLFSAGVLLSAIKSSGFSHQKVSPVAHRRLHQHLNHLLPSTFPSSSPATHHRRLSGRTP